MSQNLNDEKHPPISTEGGQPANIATALPSFKVGAISQQSLTSQLRRLQCGSSRSNVCGPIRALPLACLSGGSNEDKSQKNMSTPDGLSATKTSEDQAVKGAECVKPKILSFGSISSIESDRPGTPDAPISHGIMVSTPDLFRASSCSMNPRITSTPTAIPGSFSNAIIMDGQAPTPIIAPPAHKRITFQGSSSSSTSGRICQGIPTWEVKSQESCCSSQGSVFTPAKKYRGIPIKPQNVYKHSQKTIAFTSTPEERKNGQDIEENNKECKKVPVIDNINKIAVNNSAQEYERGQDEPVNVETVVSEVCTEVICDGKGNEVESEVNIIKETDNEIYRSKIDVTNELQSQLVSKNKSPVQVDYNPADNLPGEIQAGKSSEDHVEVCPKPASLKSLSESFSKPENTKTRIQNPTAGKENLENYSSQDGEEVGKCLSVKENDTRRDTEKEYFNVLNGDIIIVSDTQNICFDSTKLDCNGNSSDNDLCNTDAALCSPSPCVPSLKLQENLSAKPSATDSEFPKSNEDEFIDAEIKTNDNAFDSCTKNANINQLRDTKKSDKAETHQEKASDFVDKSGNSKKEEILPVNKRSVLQHLRLRSGNTKSSLARVSTSNKENLENDHPGIKKKLPGKLNSRGRSPALRDRVPAQQVASPNPGIQSQDIPKSSKADSKLVSNNKFQKITTRGKSPAPVSSSKCNLIKNTSKPLGSKDAKLQGKLPLKLSVSQTPSNNIGRIDTSKNELLKKSVSTVVKRTGSFSSKVLVPSVTSAAVRSRMGPFTQRSTSVTSTPSSLSAKQLAATQPSSAIPTRGILKSSSPSFPSARLPSKLPSLQSVSTKLPVLSTQTRRSTSAKGIVPPTSSRLKSK
ncbi:hypothetical protein SK128_006226 [Halocaridina rubra]|uniref:Uncharacterized protein n=1 Tax=Halocaridina rubra TaxID=373956 RepID=A0AAN8WLW2_HALRR